MKPASFDYAAPRTVPEAVELLGSADGTAQVLAGGQSLTAELRGATRQSAAAKAEADLLDAVARDQQACDHPQQEKARVHDGLRSSSVAARQPAACGLTMAWA
ncbi:hypothetical protein ACFYS8_32730 [Kitasatospora sp. NPDC004615]|uniref:hypothetical protein n=1 Tax=Kitasatospora sp. NPDC004615 TaxID=3364017 RepID=UPI0036D05653